MYVKDYSHARDWQCWISCHSSSFLAQMMVLFFGESVLDGLRVFSLGGRPLAPPQITPLPNRLSGHAITYMPQVV